MYNGVRQLVLYIFEKIFFLKKQKSVFREILEPSKSVKKYLTLKNVIKFKGS